MNLPNALTISRIVLTFLFIFFICSAGLISKIIAAVIFLIASLTDFYDGYYAKKYQLTSDFGKIMDPIADKVLVLAAFFVFTHMRLIPVWMFALIFIREVLITGWRLAAVLKGEVLAAEKAGKIKTVSQIVVISFILIYILLKESPFSQSWTDSFWQGWRLGIDGLMMIALVLTVFSGAAFLRNNMRLNRH